LELSFRLIPRAPLQLELLLHRGKRGDLVRQVGSQLLGLFRLLLGLALLRSCPLEGDAVLLKLGLR
jgi:hypothetical protein